MTRERYYDLNGVSYVFIVTEPMDHLALRGCVFQEERQPYAKLDFSMNSAERAAFLANLEEEKDRGRPFVRLLVHEGKLIIAHEVVVLRGTAVRDLLAQLTSGET